MPLPWETDWSMEGRKESPPDKQPKQQKPWEVDWSTASPKASRTAQKQPTIDSNAQGNTNTLENVFKKLLVAESGSKHKDEAGNLITSKVGAQGISQLMPSTAKKPGYGITPVKDDSEEEYLRVGREYLSAMYNKYQDWEKALAAYNAGTGNVDKAIGKAERYEGDWKEFLPKPKETLPYIEKILGKPKERISALNIPPDKIQKGQSAQQMVENVKQTAYDIASVAPLTGEFISAKESYEALKRGNLAEAGLAALGAIPTVGNIARVKKSIPFVDRIANERPEAFIKSLRPIQTYVGEVEDAQIHTLMHGSKSEEKFTHVSAKTSKDGALGPGFYLTGDENAAKGYGKNVRPVMIGYKKPLEITYTGKDDVVEQIASNEDFWKTNFLTKGQARKWARQQKEDFAGIGDEDFLEMLKDAGFDGVIMRDESGKIVEATAVNRNQFRFIDVED